MFVPAQNNVNAVCRFERFVERHQNLVYSSALRILGCPAEAEDASQEVFLKAYRRFGQVEALASPTAWLRTVTRNLCLNLLRRRVRMRLFSDLQDDEAIEPFENRLATGETVETTMARRGRREVIESALRRLPDAQRVPLVLFHFDDLSYEEIARRLRVPLAKVKTDIFRARQALRRLLARQAENLTVPEPTPGLCAVWERDGAHALAA